MVSRVGYDGTVQPLEPLFLQGNLAENWRRWKQHFSIYMTASGKKDESQEVKSAIFLHLAGPEALDTFTFDSPNDASKLSQLLKKFEDYCIPRKNITWERHVFNTRNKQPDETVDQYATELRSKAKTCEFGALTESLIRDRIVGGIISDKTRLKKADLTLKHALDICREDEAASTQLKKMSNSTTTANKHYVNFMKKKQPRQHPTCDSSKLTQCTRCGTQHQLQEKCPASGVKCHKCGRLNHFARVCRTREARPQVQNLDQDVESSDDDFIISAIRGKNDDDWKIIIPINSQDTSFKIDTGAQCNVMSTTTYNSLSQQPPSSSKSRLIAFGGHKLKSTGKAILLCEYKNKFWPIELDNVTIILGLKTSIEMKLIKRIEALTNDTLSQYIAVFHGLGCITGITHHIHLRPDAKPVIHPHDEFQSYSDQKYNTSWNAWSN